jgi:hypothetical protein
MPSVAMIPYFEEFASDYPDFLFLSVDVDEVKVMFFLPSFFYDRIVDCCFFYHLPILMNLHYSLLLMFQLSG